MSASAANVSSLVADGSIDITSGHGSISFGGREHPFLARKRVLVAVEERREAAVAGLAHLVELGHEQPQPGGAAEIAEEGRGTLGLPALERVGRSRGPARR